MAKHDTTRSSRRYDNELTRKRRMGHYGYDNDPPTDKSKAFGRLLHTATPCSCSMCGTPRRHYGNGSAALTIQELSVKQLTRHPDYWID